MFRIHGILVVVTTFSSLAGFVLDAAASELQPDGLETAQILSMAYEMCDGFEDHDCLTRLLEKEYFHVNVAEKQLPDGTYYTLLKLVKDDGRTVSGFFDMYGQLMNDSLRNDYELLAWDRFHSEYGNVSPELVAQLQLLSPSEPLRVAFWLVSPNITEDSEYSDRLVDESSWRDPQNDFVGFAVKSGIPQTSLSIMPGVPVVMANILPRDIPKLARFEGVATTYLYQEPTPQYCSYSSVWDDSINLYSTNGDGFPVCVIEPTLPNSTTYLYSAGEYYTGAGAVYDSHPKHVCAMIHNSYPGGPNGVSNTASCYFANWAGTPTGNISDPIYYGCIANASYIWNFSHTAGPTANRFFDYWSERWPYPFVAASAGNAGNTAVSTMGYNMMIVNEVDNNLTSLRSDDRLARSCIDSSYFTSYINPPIGEWNPTGDRELPMISAPGYAVVLGDPFAGTSAASPVVAGIVATILDDNNNLIGKPWAMRAILMAGASNDVDGTWFHPDDATVDEKDGAGEADEWLSGLIGNSLFRVTPGNTTPAAIGHDYQSLNLSSGFDSQGDAYNRYRIDGQANGAAVRVVLAWNGSAVCSDPSLSNTCSESHIDADLDLKIIDVNTNQIVGYSGSVDNSFEFVQFTPPSGDHEYEVVIHKTSATESTTKYGIAWVVWPFVDNVVN